MTIKATGPTKNLSSSKYNFGDFESGRISSLDKGVSFKYGYFEARISFDSYARGVWPAFWTLGDDIKSVNWPACGEIDIMENGANWGPQSDINEFPQSRGTANTNTGSLHFPARHGGNPLHPDNGTYVPVSNQNIRTWHTYGFKYDENHMQWFLDGQPMGDKLATPQTYKERAQFFILNLAVGGWIGGVDGPFDLGAYNDPNGQRMFVDYVRVWQKRQ
jgi:beta-glucanase (GH16 family)